MVISWCRKLKGGSSGNIQIADRGFFHHLTNVPHIHTHTRLTLGNVFQIFYNLVIPALLVPESKAFSQRTFDSVSLKAVNALQSQTQQNNAHIKEAVMIPIVHIFFFQR